jgi:hypothetical protein
MEVIISIKCPQLKVDKRKNGPNKRKEHLIESFHVVDLEQMAVIAPAFGRQITLPSFQVPIKPLWQKNQTGVRCMHLYLYEHFLFQPISLISPLTAIQSIFNLYIFFI